MHSFTLILYYNKHSCLEIYTYNTFSFVKVNHNMACVLMLSHLIRDESRSDWHQIEQIRDWNLIRKSHRFLWPAHVFDVVKSGVTVRWRLWPRRRCIGHWVGGGVVAICARFPLLQIHAAFQVVVPLGARSTTLLVGDAVDTLVEATFVVRVRVHLFAHTHFFYLADDHLLCVVTSGVNKPRHVTTDWRTLVDWRVFPWELQVTLRNTIEYDTPYHKPLVFI